MAERTAELRERIFSEEVAQSDLWSTTAQASFDKRLRESTIMATDDEKSPIDYGYASFSTDNKSAGRSSVVRVQSSTGAESQDVHSHAYKTMTWLQAGLVMVAETVSLGICALPHAMATLGLLPGCILMIALGLIAWYTGYIVYQFKLKYPGCRSFPEIGEIIAGKTGLWIVEVIAILQLVFIAAAHVLTFTVVMNVLTDHATCTVVFGVVGAIICFICTLPRTLRGQSYFSVASCTSIVTAVIIAMIAVGIGKPNLGDSYLVAASTFSQGAGSVSTIVIAYTGHIAYPNIIDEMKNEFEFPKSLAFLGLTTITFYVTIAVVIYIFGGSTVPSPAFGAASVVIQKICWGIAIPTVIVAGVIAAAICAKRIFDIYWGWRGQPNTVYENSKKAWGSWILILFSLWFVAWLIASVIPVFHELLTLIGALFATQFCLAFNGVIWLWLQWRASERATFSGRFMENMRQQYLYNWKKGCLTVLNTCIIIMSLIVTGVGLYSAITDIAKNGPSGKPFSCANNAV